MNRNRCLLLFSELLVSSAAAVLLTSCGAELGIGDKEATSNDHALEAISRLPKFKDKALCAHDDRPGIMHCHARVRTDSGGAVPLLAGPLGFSPADLKSAYKIPSGGSGKIIAIVDAYDDPKAEEDLGRYRAEFGLSACTTANGCFKKVNQNGYTSPLPAANRGWAGEIALDIEMAAATCPDCKLLLVEANSPSDTDLMAAVLTAVRLGASVISNSWGGDESSSISRDDAKWFHHPGVAITVSSGDSGYGAEYPATSRYVTSVGGTSLVKSDNPRGWAEAAWGSPSNKAGGAGSGCSEYISKPVWQTDTGCDKRTSADVSAVADPNTGVAVYDSYGGSGWAVFGGTSAAAPIVAGILAATGNSATDGSLSYRQPSAFFDITSGANGRCDGSYLCTAKPGYDGPTGNGSPNGSALKMGSCTPNCSGKTCGPDGCGGSCGTCDEDASCDSAGQCVPAPSCVHSICTTGKKLAPTCDPCVAAICAVDPYCCDIRWNSICLDEVSTICEITC